ncbi:HAD family phosphatase [Clostridium sp. cel8]|jgi:beta-phosphoglucomutase family hydrolase|uniref:HAD family hydrolase n=1 Tax=unclassified Clostridium TaxID=2614128 RepID=UPI0015F40132|nr:HAD family phosphatase [Clostridium sp. cel8]MBA5850414.1 HAD family phosphatase [Clostridium sp. cel8]
MSIRAAIFDMDGVIIDSEPDHLEINKRMFKELNINISDEEMRNFVGATTMSLWNKILNKYNLPYSLDELVSIDKNLYIEKLRKDVDKKPIDGVADLIKQLHDKNLKMAVASSSPMNVIKIITSKFNLKSYFHNLITGDEVKRSKPAPDIFLKAADTLNVSPKECIVIEDSKNGVTAAKDAGMYCIGFRNLNSGNQDLSRADVVVDHFNEVIPLLEEKLNI